jgi:hypothetical protein
MIAVTSFVYALERHSLEGIFFWLYILSVERDVEYTGEFDGKEI